MRSSVLVQERLVQKTSSGTAGVYLVSQFIEPRSHHMPPFWSMALRGVCYKNVAIKAFVPEKMKILHSAIYATGID
ncbi:hypothetical protein FJ630_18890 [Shigella flexneri]|nr:hypothetical protein [Shigella flexneri]